MGLFSKLRAEPDIAPQADPQAERTVRAVVTLPLIVAAADGRIGEDELHQILNMCAFSPLVRAVGAERFGLILGRLARDLRARGAEAVFVEAAGVLTPDLTETAMSFALRTALADGRIAPEEHQALEAMALRLGLSAETFDKILDVMTMMQRRAA